MSLAGPARGAITAIPASLSQGLVRLVTEMRSAWMPGMDEGVTGMGDGVGDGHAEASPTTHSREVDGPVWGIPVPGREAARNAAGLPTARAVRARMWELRRQLGDWPRSREEAERLDEAEEDLRLGFVHPARRATELVQAAVWCLEARTSRAASDPERPAWWRRVSRGTWIALALCAAWVAVGSSLAVTYTPADSRRVMAILAVMLVPLYVGFFWCSRGVGTVRRGGNWHGDVF